MKPTKLVRLWGAASLIMALLISGCSGDPNSDVQTDLAKLPLPKGVSDQPVEKPYKSRAKRSSPPLVQQR